MRLSPQLVPLWVVERRGAARSRGDMYSFCSTQAHDTARKAGSAARSVCAHAAARRSTELERETLQKLRLYDRLFRGPTDPVHVTVTAGKSRLDCTLWTIGDRV